LILLVAVVVIGATLRLASITAQSLWVDEATTAHEMHLSLGALLHAVRVDETTPPLYFLLAWVWAKVFGSGELGLRLFSACLGIALIPLAYGCARELVSRRAGVVAAALVAVNPFMIWYSQEARSYALFAVFSAASFLFCARAWRDPTSRNLGWWAAFSALAVLTHFFAGFLILPEALLLVVRVGRAQRRGLILAFAVIAAAQAAVLPLALSDTSHPLGWIKIFPLSVRIQQVPVDFGLGALYQSPIVTHGLLGAAVLAAIVLALLAAGGGRAERRGARFAAVVAAVTLLVPVILAALGRDYLVPRNLMAAWIPLAVVLGAACTVPRARIAGAGLAIVLLVAFVIAGVRIAQNPQYQRPNWRGRPPGDRCLRRRLRRAAAGRVHARDPLDVPARSGRGRVRGRRGREHMAVDDPAAAVRHEPDLQAHGRRVSRRALLDHPRLAAGAERDRAPSRNPARAGSGEPRGPRPAAVRLSARTKLQRRCHGSAT
jgi:4-amino-4-deoxy-L-arabinose transferase-like glycosyltransferase